MSEIINGYVLEGELKSNNSGFCKWGFATKDGMKFFIKEFLSPSYPEDTSLFTEKQLRSKINNCKKFEENRTEVYRRINNASDGNAQRIEEFFRCGTKYYVITDKLQSLQLPPQEICKMPREQKFLFCRVLSHTLMNLHAVGVVHADIKWDNVIFTGGKGGRKFTAKLIDFDGGFLVDQQPENRDEVNFDQVYCAPEVFLFINEDVDAITQKADVFSLGILIHQIFSGELPGLEGENQYVYEAMLDEAPVHFSPKLPPEIADLIKDMIVMDPDQRITAQAVFRRLCELEGKPVIIPKTIPVPEPRPAVVTPPPAEKPKKDKWFSTPGEF